MVWPQRPFKILENCLEQAPSLRCTNYAHWLSHVFCKAAQILNLMLWVMAIPIVVGGQQHFGGNLPTSIISVEVTQ